MARVLCTIFIRQNKNRDWNTGDGTKTLEHHTIDQNLLETRLDRLITEKNQDAENDNRVNAKHGAPAHSRIANGGWAEEF